MSSHTPLSSHTNTTPLTVLPYPVITYLSYPVAHTSPPCLSSHTQARQAREAALNDLEGYIYKVKNRLGDEEEELKKVSTEEQRQDVLTLSTTTEGE